MSYLADAKIILDTAPRETRQEAEHLTAVLGSILDGQPPDVARVALLVLLEAIDQWEEQQAEQTRSTA